MSETLTPVVAILLTGIGSSYQSNIGHFQPCDSMPGLLWKGRTFPLEDANDELEAALVKTSFPQRHLKPTVKIIFPEPEEEQLPPTALPLSEDVSFADDTTVTADVLAFNTCNHFGYTAKDWNNLADRDRANFMGKFIGLVESGECRITESEEGTQPETAPSEPREAVPQEPEGPETNSIEDADESQLLHDLENLHHATFKKKYGIASDEYKKLKENA